MSVPFLPIPGSLWPEESETQGWPLPSATAGGVPQGGFTVGPLPHQPQESRTRTTAERGVHISQLVYF